MPIWRKPPVCAHCGCPDQRIKISEIQFLWWLVWLAPAVAGVFAARSLIHYFQLSSYQVGGYAHTLRRRQIKVAWLPGLLTAVLCFGITYAADAVAIWLPYLFFCWLVC